MPKKWDDNYDDNDIDDLESTDDEDASLFVDNDDELIRSLSSKRTHSSSNRQSDPSARKKLEIMREQQELRKQIDDFD